MKIELSKGECLGAHLDPVTLEVQMLKVNPGLETLRKYGSVGGTGFVEMHRIGLGLEVYCDEDAALHGEPFTCYVKWRNPMDKKAPPMEIALRGPILIIDRRERDADKFHTKLLECLQPIDRELQDGRESGPPPSTPR